MEWYNILSIVLGSIGGIGGISGLIAIYNAKSNKETIDIKNKALVNDEYRKYIEKHDIEMDEIKAEVAILKEKDNENTAAIFRANRCDLPERVEDCPVWHYFQESRLRMKENHKDKE